MSFLFMQGQDDSKSVEVELAGYTVENSTALSHLTYFPDALMHIPTACLWPHLQAESGKDVFSIYGANFSLINHLVTTQ